MTSRCVTLTMVQKPHTHRVQALLIKPQDIVVQTIAYRKKWKDKLDKLKKEADQEGKKLQYHNVKS